MLSSAAVPPSHCKTLLASALELLFMDPYLAASCFAFVSSVLSMVSATRARSGSLRSASATSAFDISQVARRISSSNKLSNTQAVASKTWEA